MKHPSVNNASKDLTFFVQCSSVFFLLPIYWSDFIQMYESYNSKIVTLDGSKWNIPTFTNQSPFIVSIIGELWNYINLNTGLTIHEQNQWINQYCTNRYQNMIKHVCFGQILKRINLLLVGLLKYVLSNDDKHLLWGPYYLG